MFTVSKIRRVVSVALRVPLSSVISAGLILATAPSAFLRYGIAYARSFSASARSTPIICFCSIQASVTYATSFDLISAFLFSTSSSLSILSVDSDASLSFASSFFRSIFSSSICAEAPASFSRPLLMFYSSTSIKAYFLAYSSLYIAMKAR